MASQPSGQINNVLKESRVFPPPEQFAAAARVPSMDGHRRLWSEACSDPEGFWGKLVDQFHWFRPYRKVLQWDQPLAEWFVGGQTNVCYNCLDAHLNTPRRNKAALIWEGEPGETRVLTYQSLHREVCKFANVLKGLGIERGDVVAIYMPMVPELAVAMLACARIGAVHSVVFAGFSAEAIADRNNDAAAKLLITADAGWHRGKQLALKASVDAALRKSPTVEKCIVLRRVGCEVEMQQDRDFWWHELIEEASADCPAEPIDSNATLFIVYTRLSTIEIESALVSHPAVAEAAAVGRPHEIKGEAVAVFVTLSDGFEASEQLRRELKLHVRQEIGALAVPDDIRFVTALPKTRSGKIMRRLLRDVAAGRQTLGDTTTLEDFSVLTRLRRGE